MRRLFLQRKRRSGLGNSDFALHEAETLSNVAGNVTIYTDGEKPEFSREHTIPVNTMKIQSIQGEERVSGLKLEEDLSAQETGGEHQSFVPADGVFVAIGTAGSTEIARQMGAELTGQGNVKINEKMETTIPGYTYIYFAKAVYEGAQAGISAGQYVRQRNRS